jgi:hypothetical protein
MFLYLSLTFIVAIRVDGVVVRLPTVVLLILLFFIKFTVPFRAGFIFTAFIFYTLIQYLLFEITGSGLFSIDSVARDYVLYLCVSILYIAMVHRMEWGPLSCFAHVFFKKLVVIAMALWLISFFGVFYVGVDNSHSPPRASGLMTEPANLSHFLPAFVVYSYVVKNFRWLVTSLCLLVLTFSPTVFGVFLGTILIFIFVHSKKARLFITISLLSLIAFLFAVDYAALSGYFASKGLFGLVVNRILDGIQNIITLGEAGHNSRAALYFAGIEFLKEHRLIYTGTGFASSVVIAEKFNDGMLFDSTTLFTIFMWFGIFSLPVYLYVQWLVIRNLSHDFLSILLMSLCVSNIITGGGVWIQMFFWSLLWLRFRTVKYV